MAVDQLLLVLAAIVSLPWWIVPLICEPKEASFPQVSFATVTGQYGWYSIFSSIFALPMTLRFLTSQEIMMLAVPSPSLWGLFRVVKTFLECILSPTPDVQLERFFFRLPAKSQMWREGSVGVLTLCVSTVSLTATHELLLPCKRFRWIKMPCGFRCSHVLFSRS